MFRSFICSSLILTPVSYQRLSNTAFTRSPSSRGGGADQVHHRLEAYQGFSFPVHTDEREHPVLDLVPLAGPRRIVTHHHFQSGFITEALQVELPGPVAISVAAPAVRADEHLPRARVVPTAKYAPPSSDTLHREFGRVVGHSHIHHPLVAIHIISSVRNGHPLPQTRKIVNLHLRGLALLPPFSAWILEFPHPFLLLGVDRNHRLALGQKPLRGLVEVAKLSVALGMRSSLLVLDVGLQRVVQLP